MPCAEIITIGTELLLGEIQDTNTRYLARKLREIGINLYRSTMVGDNAARIAEVIQEARNRADILLVTGGLGPTVDDPTREAIAMAAGVNLIFKDELWQQIQQRFEKYNRTPTENNKKQALIPEGSFAIKNDVGTAPAFYILLKQTLVIAFPGVPKELEYIFEHDARSIIQNIFPSDDVILVKVLHTAGLGESMIDDLIGEHEKSENPTVGLLAHPGQVDIRITAKAKTKLAAEEMIACMETPIRSCLEAHIYGVDHESIEEKVVDIFSRSDIGVSFHFEGFPDEIIPRIDSFITKVNQINRTSSLNKADFMVVYIPGPDRQELRLSSIMNSVTESDIRYYGGPPSLGPSWGINTAFEFIRNIVNR
jgi:nicotinamide-nucleotide amidase